MIYTDSMITNNEKEAFSKRLNAVLDRVGVPPKGKGRQLTLAKTFGMSQKGVRKWLEGEAIPSSGRISQILRVYKDAGVSGEWLLYGNEAYTPSWFENNAKIVMYQ